MPFPAVIPVYHMTLSNSTRPAISLSRAVRPTVKVNSPFFSVHLSQINAGCYGWRWVSGFGMCQVGAPDRLDDFYLWYLTHWISRRNSAMLLTKRDFCLPFFFLLSSPRLQLTSMRDDDDDDWITRFRTLGWNRILGRAVAKCGNCGSWGRNQDLSSDWPSTSMGSSPEESIIINPLIAWVLLLACGELSPNVYCHITTFSMVFEGPGANPKWLAVG